VEYDIIHDRNLKDLKKSNRNRNVIASREQVGMQEQFIAKVENYLEAQK
jgi:hypothetical protein